MSQLINMLLLPFSFMLLANQVSHADRVLRYPRIQQEKSQWCWNGCAQWILGFHGIQVSQTEICQYAFTDGKVRDLWNWTYTDTEEGAAINTGGLPDFDWSNFDWSNFDWTKGLPGTGGETVNGRGINFILQHWGVTWKIKPGSGKANYVLSEEEFKREMEQGHPFIVRWAWDNGGHITVAIGYQNKMCWIMNPWEDDGIQIYDYQWVRDNVNNPGKHHVWDYTLQTTRIDTVPELTTVFPSSVAPGQTVSLKLTSTLNGRDVTKSTFYKPLTPNVAIDSSSRIISWTQTAQGPSEVKFTREFGNAVDTVVKAFGSTNVPANMARNGGLFASISKKADAGYKIAAFIPRNASPITKVALYSKNGAKVFARNLTGTGSVACLVPGNQLAKGVYILNLTNGNKRATGKLFF